MARGTGCSIHPYDNRDLIHPLLRRHSALKLQPCCIQETPLATSAELYKSSNFIKVKQRGVVNKKALLFGLIHENLPV